MKVWYGALIRLRTVPMDDDDSPSVDNSVRLVHAESLGDARRRLLALGQSLETTYSNPDGETVSWVFDQIVEIQQLTDSPGNGVEVFSWMDL